MGHLTEPGEGRFHHGEILSGLKLVTLSRVPDVEAGANLFETPEAPWLIILTQDCDLEQDYSARHPGIGPAVRSDKKLWGVIVAPGWAADEVEERSNLRGPGYEDQVGLQRMGRTEAEYLRSYRHERFYFVGADALIDGEELAFDFKLATAVSVEYLEDATATRGAARRAQLTDVWANHLSHRFINYFGRVPLPDQQQ